MQDPTPSLTSINKTGTDSVDFEKRNESADFNEFNEFNEFDKSNEFDEFNEFDKSNEFDESDFSGLEKDSADWTDENLPQIRIILVEPLYQGNVGSVCRVMKNFGFLELFLVNPCPLEGEARAMASHADDVLKNARICKTMEEAVLGCDVIIGTTGSRAYKKCDHIRTPALSPRMLKERMDQYAPDTKFALLFGREDKGFTNEELSFCSVIATIPTSHIYPVMNLSHAVGVILYELSGAEMTGAGKTVDFESFNALCTHFDAVLQDIDFTPHKKDKMVLMMRRILGRSNLTPCEAQTLRGIFRNIQYHAKKGKGEDVGKLKLEIKNQFEKDDFSFLDDS
ncbi:RNA methyltransferase [Methanolapillus ohkumae]|uniref:tRNA (Cytidine(34)-2'-O)-methyltransferase n=1 Tax=Methanolapillus ohkumae TaxID=3028298 RepID=A0AA96V839_9EURY|nr:tRNA (cytidine(34)-2'-O)-methyltransferase [Methanosarcinaceae archaeon Am2]